MEQPLGSRYFVGDLLGRGGMGAVYRGRESGGSPCAIKLLRPELAADADIVTRFVAERRMLTGISHPNLVEVRDLVVEGDSLAIVMDLVEGPDLRQELNRLGTFAPAEAARIGAGVARALGAAHERGVLHRDVKPENILLDRREDPPGVRLADFGIARLIGDSQLSRVTGIIGTPSYLPPEVYAGEAAGPAGDLYALGVLLYEMTSGVPPFVGDMVAVMAGHVGVTPGRPPQVPDRLWELIERLLRKDPGDRTMSARAVADELDGLTNELAGLPAATKLARPPAGSAVTPWRSRSSVETQGPLQLSGGAGSGRGFRRVGVIAAVAGVVVIGSTGAWAALARPWSDDCDASIVSRDCGSKAAVEEVQARLVELCYYERNDSAQIDGDFGGGTEAALRRFQAGAGLDGTGIADARTRFLLAQDSARSLCKD